MSAIDASRSGGNAFRAAAATFLVAATMAVSTPAMGQGMFGPGKFKIEHIDDRFSTSSTTMVIGHNNRVTKKSPVGGIYINSQGLYLNPVVVKSRVDGKVVRIGFIIENRTELDTTYGSPNSLGSLSRVGFLINGTLLIPGTVTAAEQRFADRIDYNTISRSASSRLNESGMVYLTPSDMAALAGATSVAIQVQGSARLWTIEDKDVAKTFIANVRAFYEQQVAAAS